MTNPQGPQRHGKRTYTACGARKHQGQGNCTLPAGWGTDHAGTGRCKLHGGSTPDQRAKAQRDQAEAAVKKLGIPKKTTAQEALRAELELAYGNLAILTDLVAGLDPADLAWGQERRVVRPGPPGPGGQPGPPQVEVTLAARVNPVVKLWQEERDRCKAVAVEMERLGLEARQVRVNEAIGFRVLQTVRLILSDLGLSQEQLALAKEAVPRRLKELVGA